MPNGSPDATPNTIKARTERQAGWKGECRHCGACCDITCKYFRWIALRDIKAGEFLVGGMGHDMRSLCMAYAYPDEKRDAPACTRAVLEDFPFGPASRRPGCGFYWPTEEVTPDGN